MATPPQLQEWVSWANRLSTAELHDRKDYQARASNWDELAHGTFTDFYLRAVRDGDVAQLREWLSQPSVPTEGDERAVRNLLHLIYHLRVRGWEPFSSQRLFQLGEIPPPRPDWSKLPDDMAFLAEAAVLVADVKAASQDPKSPLRALTAAHTQYLTGVARQIPAAGCARVMGWWKRLGVVESVEAALVFDLLVALDSLGIEYA